jgi:DNA repair exonuclease SbcCD ATPase subunit
LRIRVKNFRQHKAFDINLPDLGLIQLSGKSGIGKTSILDSIEEGLYGSADDVYEWGSVSKNVSVELWIKDLYIKRTRGPASLVVQSPALTEPLLEEAAQLYINSTMNMNNDEFHASSYIKQGQSNSFLTLGSSDQLKFIQKLSSGDIDEGLFKESLNLKIKTCTQEIEKKDTEILGISKSIQYEQDMIGVLDRTTLPTKPEYSKADLTQHLSHSHTNIAVLAADKTEKQKYLARCLAQKEKIAAQEKLKQSIEHISGDLLLLQSEKEQVIQAIKNMETREKLLSKKELKTGYIQVNKIKQLMYNLSQQVFDKYKNVSGNLLEWMVEQKNEAHSYATNIKEKIATLKSELKSLELYQSSKPCPHCDQEVYVVRGGLEKAPMHDIQRYTHQISTQVFDLSNELTDLQTKIDDLTSYILQANHLKENLLKSAPSGAEPTETIECIDAEIRVLDDLTANFNALDKKITQLAANKTNIALMLKDNCEDIDVLSTDATHQEISKIDTLLLKETIERNRLTNLLEQWSVYINKLALWQSAQDDISIMRDSISRLEESRAVATAMMNAAKERLSDLLLIRTACDKASLLSLEGIINLINQNTSQYIDDMFAEDGTVITVKNCSVTQKGEERAKVSVEILHKGKKAKGIKSLSGGEKSRAALAFQLGLSEMYNSPILLVDEGFTGIDREAQEECIEILKRFSEDRLVIVIEHGAPEHLFDKVVCIS